jgi:antitoxin HicB
MTNKRDLQYFMALPYKIEIAPTEDGTGFTARIPDLKGCIAYGETVEEAYEMVADVKQAWIEIALEEGWAIPEPSEEEIKEYSGRFNVRLPRYLHRSLAETAEVEDTSLNQLVVALLSEGVERRRHLRRATQFVRLIESSAAAQVTLLEQTLARAWKKAPAASQWAEEPRAIWARERESHERRGASGGKYIKRVSQKADRLSTAWAKKGDLQAYSFTFEGDPISVAYDDETAD